MPSLIEPSVVSTAMQAIEFKDRVNPDSETQGHFGNVLGDFKSSCIGDYLMVEKTPGLFFNTTFSAAISSATSFSRAIS